MRTVLWSCLSLALLCGCRRDDWKEIVLPLPEQVSVQAARQALAGLDRETPPEVRDAAGQLHIRYNSMHVASRNLIVALEELQMRQQKEAQP